jgi:hypothetical protein
MKKQALSLLTFGALLLLLQGCAPSSYAVDSPQPSAYVFVPAEADNTTAIDIVDTREDAYSSFSFGVLPMALTHQGTTLDPIDYLSRYTLAELAARGAPVAAGGTDATEVLINKVVMRNYRSTGWSPFTTTTVLSADIMLPAGPQRIGAFVIRGKVPVWSFDEVIEPTLNQPLELLVQDLAAKINMHVFEMSASDATVQQLIANVNANPADGLAYLDVYQLGFSNNRSAIDALVEFTGSPHEYVRLAAISALGTINAYDHVDHLIEIFSGDANWRDRTMALKSLGDIAVMGSDQALSFMHDDAETVLVGETQVGAEWCREVLGLYLRQ